LAEKFNRRLIEMKKLLLMIAVVFIFSACASSEPKTDIRDVNLDNAVAENGDKLYCRRERVTGTRMKTTTCLTKAQKDAAQRASEDYVNKLKRSPQHSLEKEGG
jgi:PhoPQ-activated pathogenicity-related protein